MLEVMMAMVALMIKGDKDGSLFDIDIVPKAD